MALSAVMKKNDIGNMQNICFVLFNIQPSVF